MKKHFSRALILLGALVLSACVTAQQPLKSSPDMAAGTNSQSAASIPTVPKLALDPILLIGEYSGTWQHKHNATTGPIWITIHHVMCNKAYGWGEVSQRYMTGAFAEDHPTKFVQKMQTACNALYGGEADFVTYDPEDNVCELTIMGRVVHQPVAPASQ